MFKSCQYLCCLALCFLTCGTVFAESFDFEERDWEINDPPIIEEIKFVQLNNGAYIELLEKESGQVSFDTVVGFNAEKDLHEEIESDFVTIESAHPNTENASAVIISASCGGSSSDCLYSHYYLVVPEENFLKKYYMGPNANCKITLDENNQITDIRAKIYVGRDTYLTRQYKTCRFIKDVGFVDLKTNSNCNQEESPSGETDFFLS